MNEHSDFYNKEMKRLETFFLRYEKEISLWVTADMEGDTGLPTGTIEAIVDKDKFIKDHFKTQYIKLVENSELSGFASCEDAVKRIIEEGYNDKFIDLLSFIYAKENFFKNC